MNIDLNVSFKFHSIKKWFNENYFICLYDKFDNYVTSFDSIEDTAKFFNVPLKKIVNVLKNNLGIQYKHERYKLICIEKDKEDFLDLDERGKRL